MPIYRLVFTGTATDGDGKPVVRRDLEAACMNAGIQVAKYWPVGVDYVLVASRTDTVKAQAAKARGLKVLTYTQIIDVLAILGHPVVPTGAAPDKYVDAVPENKTTAAPKILETVDPKSNYGGDL